jgi:uncharacterized protein involved in outer membrane biogenesis
VKKKFFKYLKRTLLGLAVFIVLLFTTAFIIAYFFEDKVKDYIIKQINKQLNTEITVKEIDLSLIKRFPYASLTFSDVEVKEAIPDKKKENILKAETVYLQFSVFDLFDKNYRIKKIEVVNGALNLKVFKNGTDNFHILKPSSDSTADKNFKFDLQKLIFDNVFISYKDFGAGEDYAFNANNLIVKGMFSKDDYTLYVNGDMLVRHMISGKINYINDKKTALKLVLKVNNNNGLYEFEKGELKIGENAFKITGNVVYSEKQKTISLLIKSKDLAMQKLINEMPATYKKYLNEYESKGILEFSCTIKGKYNDNYYPTVLIDFKIENGEFLHKGSGIALEKVNASGVYTNGSMQTIQTNSLKLKGITATLKSRNIKGDLSIDNFVKPEIMFEAEADLNLLDLKEFLKIDTITSLSGEAFISISYKGQLSDINKFTAKDFIGSTTTGKLVLKNLNFRLKNDLREYKDLNGNFQFSNNDIIIEKFTGKVSSSDFDMKGYFRNIIPYLFMPNQKLQVDADVSCGNIDIAELMQESTTVTGVSKYKFSISDKLDIVLDINAEKLKFNKFEASKIKGSIRVNNCKLFADEVYFNAMNGSITGTGVVDNTNPEKLSIKCDAAFNKLDINKTFYQFGNFGQTTITEKNMKGLVTANVQMISEWNNKLEADMDKLNVHSDFTIENGELNDYEPMQELSKFLKLADLNHITFATLKNQFDIVNKTITFPGMEIKSSALNLYVSGTHSFDNKINYNLRLLLSDILAKKAKNAKKENEDFGVVEDDGLGKYTLYIMVTGTVDKPEFKYDTKGLKNKILLNVVQEKQNLKTILKEEFKWLKKDTTLKKEQIELQENDKFIIEWDDKPKK